MEGKRKDCWFKLAPLAGVGVGYIIISILEMKRENNLSKVK